MVRFVFATLIAVGLATTAAGEKLPDAMPRKYPPEMPEATAEVYKKVGDAELRLYVFTPGGGKPAEKTAGGGKQAEKTPGGGKPAEKTAGGGKQTGEKADGAEGKSGRPAIVFFFGGGWKGGSPEQFRHQCRYLASRGMVAITADYRVSSRNDVKAVDCVRDAVSAMRYVRANAARLGIDPKKIVAAGGSAGGHLAACVGVIERLDDQTGRYAEVDYRPNGMVLFNPVLMFGEKPGIAITSERTGVDPEEISPFHHVKSERPPTLLLFGTADSMIDSARAFRDAMRKAGNRCELEEYADRPHGFFNVGRKANKDFFATLEAADRFLGSLGYLEGEPRVDGFFER